MRAPTVLSRGLEATFSREELLRHFFTVRKQFSNETRVKAQFKRLHPLVRSRLLIEIDFVQESALILRDFADKMDWEEFCILFHFYFIENCVVDDRDFVSWITRFCDGERRAIPDEYKGVIASAVIMALSQQGNHEMVNLVAKNFCSTSTFPMQPYGGSRAWDSFSDRRHRSYLNKHGQNLTDIYQDMLSLFGDSLRDVRTHIDLGCGSGLLGQVFASPARSITGLDQSRQFLKYLSKVYDEVVQEDLISYIARKPKTFDLVTAGGVIQYFNHLEKLFALVAGVLNVSGYFGFNTIHSEVDDIPLTPNGPQAVAHSLPHVLFALEQSGFEVTGTITKAYWQEHRSDVIICRRI